MLLRPLRRLLVPSLLLAHARPTRAMASFASAPGTGTIRTGDGTITVNPTQPYSGLVILMHGLGDSAEGFADVAEMWARSAPHIKFILPTAPTQPVTLNGGFPMPSWYDIVGLSERSNENCEGIEASRDTVVKIMEEEVRVCDANDDSEERSDAIIIFIIIYYLI